MANLFMGSSQQDQMPMCKGCSAFFEMHSGVIKAAALAHTNAFVEYADLTQMLFLRLIEWKSRQTCPLEVTPGFFYTIASNLAISEYRKRRQEIQMEDHHQMIFEQRIDPSKESNPEIKALVDQILKKVDGARDRDAVFSWYTDEPIEEFASRHKLSKSNASVVRFRAVKKLSADMLALEGETI